MAKNQVFKFVDVLSLPVPAGTKSGDPVEVGELVGVAETDRSERSDTGADAWDETYGGGNGEGHASVALKGAYALTVTGALAIGQAVYFTADGNLSATGGGRKFGVALTTKGAGEGTATVLIAPGAPVTDGDDGDGA